MPKFAVPKNETEDEELAFGWTESVITASVLLVHWIHSIVVMVCYLYFIRNVVHLALAMRSLYLAFAIVTNAVFYCIVSVFYVWAWQNQQPLKDSRKHRIIGIVIHFFVCDVPIFVLEVYILWTIGLVVFIQAFCFIWSCVSLLYSTARFWAFVMGAGSRHSKPKRRDSTKESFPSNAAMHRNPVEATVANTYVSPGVTAVNQYHVPSLYAGRPHLLPPAYPALPAIQGPGASLTSPQSPPQMAGTRAIIRGSPMVGYSPTSLI
jgi:hypothetical protein